MVAVDVISVVVAFVVVAVAVVAFFVAVVAVAIVVVKLEETDQDGLPVSDKITIIPHHILSPP